MRSEPSVADATAYRLLGITKTPFRTRLVSTDAPLTGVTDYVMVLPVALTDLAASGLL